MTSQLSAALRAAAAGIHPDDAGTGLIISHGVFLHRDDFARHIETAACISDGTPMAWIDWTPSSPRSTAAACQHPAGSSASSASRPASPPATPSASATPSLAPIPAT